MTENTRDKLARHLKRKPLNLYDAADLFNTITQPINKGGLGETWTYEHTERFDFFFKEEGWTLSEIYKTFPQDIIDVLLGKVEIDFLGSHPGNAVDDLFGRNADHAGFMAAVVGIFKKPLKKRSNKAKQDLDYDNHNFTKRKAAITIMLNRRSYCQDLLPEEERAYFERMINDHHRTHGNTIIHSVKLIQNLKYGHYNFWADYTKDGVRTTDIIGVGSTLSKSPNREDSAIKRAKAIRFMRYCIGPDMTEKRRALVNDDPHCKSCGVEVTESSSHLDHCGKLEFRHLADYWLDTPYDDWPNGNIERVGMVSNSYACDKFDNPEVTANWISFHHAAAEVQLLCATCNLKKTKA